MPVTRVEDPADPRLVELAGLTDAQARARIEAEHGCFVAEGLLALDAVLRSPYPVRSVLVAENKLDRVTGLLARAPDPVAAEVYVGSRALLRSVTGFDIHRGVVASAGRLQLPRPEDLLTATDRVIVVEGVNDHENLGALFRNAAAFGVGAVLLDPTCADPLYRRSVRVSLGHVLRVPWSRIPSAPGGIDVVRAAGHAVLALSPKGEVEIREAVHRWGRGRLAWLVGAEGPGLGPDALARADGRVRIPLAEGVDSLNVATAAAVALAFSWARG